jgi:hypothetical protein
MSNEKNVTQNVTQSEGVTPVTSDSLYPPLSVSEPYDPLTEKQIFASALSKKEYKKCVTKNVTYFGAFVIKELTDIASENPTRELDYNIKTTEEDSDLKKSLKKYLRENYSGDSYITIRIDGKIICDPRYRKPGSNGFYAASSALSGLFDTYFTKTGDHEVGIVDLSPEEQIEALSTQNLSHIAKEELAAWQTTLKKLLENAKGNKNETQQVEVYIKKTQAIIRILNQPSLLESGEKLANAVSDFVKTIKALSNKDNSFITALAFSTTVLISVFSALVVGAVLAAVTCPPLAVLLVGAALIAASAIIAASLEAYQLENPEKSKLLIKPELLISSRLGLYTHYKGSALMFANKVKEGVPPAENTEASPSSPTLTEEVSNKVPTLSPVYVATNVLH